MMNGAIVVERKKVGTTQTQTLTNKTLTTPVIASLYQDAGKTKLITFPAETDTIVTLAATQALTNKTLDAAVAKGTWTASGTWTIPAFTAGGAIDANTNYIYDLPALYGEQGDFDFHLIARRDQANVGNALFLDTFNASNSAVSRLVIQGGINEATAAWAYTVHTGLKLGGALTLNAQDLVADTTTGTKIGTAADQKLAFFGDTPIVQIAKASYNNWTAFTDVIDALVALGLFDAA